jgi:DNA replication protein DnaC
MTAHPEIVPSVVDRIKQTMVALKMPRAIEILDATVRRLEHREMTALEAIDALLAEEFTLRENRRIKTALVMARLSTIKTLAGFDFSFQPSLDKNCIMALAELKFIDRAEVLHLVGPPGTGKSHLSLALGVEAIKAGRSVYFTTLADLVGALAKAERSSTMRSVKAACARRSGSSAASRSSSSMRLVTCRSFPAAAIYSSSSSTPAMKKAP